MLQRQIPLRDRDRAPQVLEQRVKVASGERERLHRRREEPVQARGKALRRQLVKRAGRRGGVDSRQTPVRDARRTVDGVKVARRRVAAEGDGIRVVLREDLAADQRDRVRGDAVGPVFRDPLLIVEGPGAVGLRLGAEEAGDRREVGRVVGAGGHQLVQEGRGAEEQEGQRPEVEVAVVGERLVPALVAVQREVGAIEVALAGVLHHAEEGAVEVEVVAVGEEVVVARERGVGFELVVAGEPRFGAGEERSRGRSGRGVAANGEPFGQDVAIAERQTEDREQDCQIVADVIYVLLGVD